MTDNLPPLPEPGCSRGIAYYCSSYTIDQMREYGRACAKTAYERAEQACLAIRSDSSDGYYDAIADCVHVIRALGDSNDR